VKIDFKSKVSGKYKGDLDMVTLKRMELPMIPQEEEFVVMKRLLRSGYKKRRLRIPTQL